MSRNSRRKTLSHAEIENFLFDLQAEEVVKPEPEIHVSQAQQTAHVVDDADMLKSIIRDLYKDMSRKTLSATTLEMCNRAKQISELSNYPIIPSRIVYPERYVHPNNSLEAKKALLMSMSPMLADAENQKKIDSTNCEEFTRCRVGKTRTRHSTYDYVDIDTNTKLSPVEYCRRYMMYIRRHKGGCDDSVISSTESVPLDGALTPAEEGESTDEDLFLDEKFLWDDEDEDMSSHRARSRRMTISPSSSQHILHDELTECELTEERDDKKNHAHIHLDGVDESSFTAIPAPEDRISEEDEAGGRVEEECVQCTERIRTDASCALSAAESSPDNTELPENPLTVQSENEAQSSPPISSKDIHDDIPCIDIDLATASALGRYHVRREMARWKYLWEMASLHAAHAAANRARAPRGVNLH